MALSAKDIALDTRMTEDGRRRSEDREKKSEVGKRRRAEDGRQRTDDCDKR